MTRTDNVLHVSLARAYGDRRRIGRIDDAPSCRLGKSIVVLLCTTVMAFAYPRPASAAGEWPSGATSSQTLPSFQGAIGWLNSPPLDAKALRGKVVLVDFWTYSCINCLRTLPYLRSWSQKYSALGLVVIGIHTPEFEFERSTVNVQRAVKDLGIAYPVVVDSRQALWNAFGARAWPTLYFVDVQGRIRGQQLGEGNYDKAERMIQQLLREAGRDKVPVDLVSPQAAGTQAAPGSTQPESIEAYLGTDRAEGFVASPGPLRSGPETSYSPASKLRLNQWTLGGVWKAEPQQIEAVRAGAIISYRFRARDLHLVLSPARDGRPVRFKIRIDGKAPGADRGSDVDAEGAGRIDAQRLYQLVRQRADAPDRLFEIEFLDPGARAYAFTFG